jgi:hypothetical protein
LIFRLSDLTLEREFKAYSKDKAESFMSMVLFDENILAAVCLNINRIEFWNWQ